MHASLAAITAALAIVMSGPSTSDAESLDVQPIYTFDSEEAVRPWRPLHDRVMGGVSTGDAEWKGDLARFAGELSLENNGGFASFRVYPEPALDLAGTDGIHLRVRGDGQNWKLSLSTRQGRSGRGWQAPFHAAPAGEWVDVFVPWTAFEPSYRGRYARTDEPLDREAIETFGLQISDKQEGPFQLDVRSIGAWTAPEGDGFPGTMAAHQRRTDSLATRLAATPTATEVIEATRRQERLLVIAEPLPRGNFGAEASIVRGRLSTAMADVAERDLRVVHLLGDSAVLVAGQQLPAEAARALREEWRLPRGEWRAALVGKDGAVKERWEAPMEPADVFSLIDAMPMRQREARERGTEH